MTPAVRYSEAILPTVHGEFRIAVYQFGDEEAVALWRGEVAGQADVLARVHSECLTGEVFGSLRCDCRSQLELALGRIAEHGAGVLVYLRQEGRGIGLGNKVKAYALQDAGRDTVDANLELGFAADLRSYEMAASILGDLGVQSVRLMTNNPAKVEGLAGAGVPVSSTEAHWAEAHEASQPYLETKRSRMGHTVPGHSASGHTIPPAVTPASKAGR
jgi:3,4-dihydroxy 2-butanone 4-phosphate synthase / GTP cyclohydrolase II